MKINNQKLLIAMARLSLNTGDVSKASGIGMATVSKLKNGRLQEIEPKTAGKIADALKVDITEII